MKRPLMINGIDLEQEEVQIISLPPIKLSTRKVNDTEVDGRDGTLTEYDGYTSDTKNVEADYRGNNPLKILSLLEGTKEVIFGNLPDRYYKCRLDNQIPLDQVIENQLYNFLIAFKCQPFGYLLEGKELIELTQPTTIDNPGTYKAKPIISVFGTGACTLTINNKAFYITEIGGSITIDSDIEEVYEGKGRYFETDLFPVFPVGNNNISWTGNVTKVEMIPNWRCI